MAVTKTIRLTITARYIGSPDLRHIADPRTRGILGRSMFIIHGIRGLTSPAVKR